MQSVELISGQSVTGGGGVGTPKTFRGGTQRVISPAETLARARRIFGPVGITRVANVTGLDCIGIPVVVVCRPNSRSLAVSLGKGCDLDAARASGVMEAIELYHAERVVLPLKLASFNELRFDHRLVQIDRLPAVRVSEFRPDRGLLWTQGVNLFDGANFWLPFELVHTNYTLPLPTGSGCFVMSSNGLASGNHLLEAVIHGLCEVIERDSAALFRFRPEAEQRARRVDPSTVQDPEIQRLFELYDRADVSVVAWDITTDIAVPAFRCVILDRTPNAFRPLGPIEGYGCHPVRTVALLRALTEAAQGRLTRVAGSRDDAGRSHYRLEDTQEFVRRAQAMLREPATRPFDATPTRLNETLEDDVSWILGQLAGAGLSEAIVVDLTKAEFGIPVVRVVVPGLETYHHVQGYVPGERVKRLVGDRHSSSGVS
jgi:YcaO-like protein with predicted kinase domain